MHLRWRGSRGDVFSSFLASKSYQNIKFHQIKDRDINLVIIYLIFYHNWNFLTTHVDARSPKRWFFSFFGSQQPMRRELANSHLKANIKNRTNCWIYEIFIWIWSCLGLNCLIFEADSEYELENIDLKNFWKFYFFLSLTHTVHFHACEMEREQRRRFFIIFGLKKLPEYKIRSNKRQGHKSGDYLSHFLSKLKFSCDPCRCKKSKTVIFYFLL